MKENLIPRCIFCLFVIHVKMMDLQTLSIFRKLLELNFNDYQIMLPIKIYILEKEAHGQQGKRPKYLKQYFCGS